MENELWLDVSSKNLLEAKEFFTKLELALNERHNGQKGR